MGIDGIYLYQLKNELAVSLKDARVDKIHQPSKEELVLQLRSVNFGGQRLLISIRPSAPRINFTDTSYENPADRFRHDLPDLSAHAGHFPAGRPSDFLRLHEQMGAHSEIPELPAGALGHQVYCLGHPRHAADAASNHRLLRTRPDVRLELR